MLLLKHQPSSDGNAGMVKGYNVTTSSVISLSSGVSQTVSSSHSVTTYVTGTYTYKNPSTGTQYTKTGSDSDIVSASVSFSRSNTSYQSYKESATHKATSGSSELTDSTSVYY